MFAHYYGKMYISLGGEGHEDECPHNVTIVNTDTRQFRLFKWALNKAIGAIYNGDAQTATRLLGVADAYFKAASYQGWSGPMEEY